jgi:hypothetical protein
VGREEQLQWERDNARWAAAAAVLAAILPVAATVYATNLLGKLPDNRDDIFLQRIHQDSSGYIISGVITGIGVILLAPVLVYLYRATVARRAMIPKIALILAIAAPVLSGVIGVARQVVLVNTADQFVKQPPRPLTDAQKANLNKITDAKAYATAVDKLGPTGVAKDKLQSGSVATVAYVGLVANLLLATAFVMISLHAMRAGLLSRFMGILGIIVGVLTAIPLLGGAPVVQLFWLVAMGMLFLGRWPQGRGPAWDSGEAIPWPSAADKRDELRGGEAPARGRSAWGRPAAAAPEVEEEADDDEPLHTREAARPRASAEHSRSKKRKRKRRG